MKSLDRKICLEHPDKAVETGGRFKYVMAIALDSSREYKEGLIRCITSREGNVEVSGYVDRSELYIISIKDSYEHFSIGKRLKMLNEDKIISELSKFGNLGSDFIGFEDPDLFFDEKAKLLHLYFTMPFLITHGDEKHAVVHLGHAVGNDLSSLEMTRPVLMAEMDEFGQPGAKELSVVPINKQGIRLNLVESSKKEKDFTYSTVRIAIAEDMGKLWKFGETVFHPKEHEIPWIGGHASPGPLFSREFIDVGEGKRLGIMNGREANQRVGNKIKYGIFSVGLFIYDYENGKIDWVSPKPLIRDSEAKTITFASQFVQTKDGESILYAHVDDSFVRASTIFAEGLKSMLP